MSYRRITVVAVLVLACQALVGWTPAWASCPPRPTGITVEAATDNTGLGGAVPAVLVQAGSPFTLTVAFTPAGATRSVDTVLDLAASLDGAAGGSPHGSFSPSTIVMPAGASSQTFSISYSGVDNGVILHASVAASHRHHIASGETAPFDVLATLLPLSRGDPRFGTGVGVGDDGCTSATTEPECGVVVLPNDIQSPKGALTLGRCTADLGCTNGSQVVQFIADLGTRYSKLAPATLIVRCDKSLCRHTANGIKDFTLEVSQAATGPLDHVSQPCAAKGVADNGLDNGDTFCTDYVQSHRNHGDVLLYLLFTQDMRGSI